MATNISETSGTRGSSSSDELQGSCTSPTQTKCLWRSKRMTCDCSDCADLKSMRRAMIINAVCSTMFIFSVYADIGIYWNVFLLGHSMKNCQSPSLSFTGGILSLRTEALAFNTSLAALLCFENNRIRNRMWKRNPAHHLLLGDRIHKVCFRTLATFFTICVALVISGIYEIPDLVKGYGDILERRAVIIDIIVHLVVTVILTVTITVMFWRLVDIHIGHLIGYKYRKALFDRDLCGEWPVLLWSSLGVILEKCFDGVKTGIILFVIGVTLPMWAIFYLKGSQGPNECWPMEIYMFPFTAFVVLLVLSWDAFRKEITLRMLVGKGELEALSVNVIEQEALPAAMNKYGSKGHTNCTGNQNISTVSDYLARLLDKIRKVQRKVVLECRK